MASNTDPSGGRGVLAVAVTALLVASAVVAGVSLAAVGTASAEPTRVNSCTTIDEPGTYELTGNVSYDGEERTSCIDITTSDVAFDGNGYTIEPAGPPGSRYVVVNGDSSLTNVTVRDVALDTVASDPVRAVDVSDSTFSNVDVTSEYVDPGRVTVVGDNNTVSGLTGQLTLNVSGDDNRLLDNDFGGFDGSGLILSGDRNVVHNVDTGGYYGLDLSGTDNRVTDSSFSGAYDGPSVYLSNATNATLVNNTLTAQAVFRGVVLANTTGSTFADTEFNGLVARFESSDDNAIRNGTGLRLSIGPESEDNTIRGNSVFTERTSIAGESNLIYDNRISVPSDEPLGGSFGEYVTGNNTWNVSAQPGANAVGGDSLGGNYYVDDEGTGYSQTCEDADGDGFCDEPLRINDGNTDYLPLAEPSNDTEQPGDGNGSGTNVTDYQVDFVAGQPIEELGEDGLYAEQDRLMRFAFGEVGEGITGKDTAWPNESLRAAVDYGHIVEHGNGTASVTFTVADGETVTLSLVTYSMPGETFDMDTVDQQELLNGTTETFGPGEHTITVDLPDAEEGDSDDE